MPEQFLFVSNEDLSLANCFINSKKNLLKDQSESVKSNNNTSIDNKNKLLNKSNKIS